MTDLPEIRFTGPLPGTGIGWREWGSGEPLVMLHGWSMSSVVFTEVASLMKDRFRVICPDLPGHGASAPLPVSSLEELAKRLTDWWQQLDLKNADLLGWSLGGQLALQLAADGLVQPRRLVLVATTPKFCNGDGWAAGLPQTQVRALQRNLGRAYEKTLGDFFKLQFDGEQLSRERYREIIRFAVRAGRLPDPEIASEYLQLLGAADQRCLLDRISQPVLVTHGELDRIIPLAAGEHLASQLCQAELHRMTEVGHAPFFSRPAECADSWCEFLG